MAERLTIKQIAALSGVSIGTVDRVLHNRGMVSKEAYAAVQAVLDKNAYEYNIHTSAVAFKKTKKVFNIVITIPSSDEGEYWDMMKTGLEKGLNEYMDIPTNITYIHFDQFSSISCSQAFDKVAETSCNAVIMGTTFEDEVRRLCKTLDEKKIPYVFVDGMVSETRPVANYLADQQTCGKLLARLMDKMTPADSEIAIMLPKRIATKMSNNSKQRLESFKAYFEEINSSHLLKEAFFSTDDEVARGKEVQEFLKDNPKVKGIAVVISTSYLIAEAVKKQDNDITIGGFDITLGNTRCICNDSLDFVIDQHPVVQGFKAVEATIHYLLYSSAEKLVGNPIPVNVVFKENLPEISQISIIP